MGPKLPKRTNSFHASMPMLIPCLPSVVFVALPMPMCLCLCRFCVCQQRVCDNAYVHMPMLLPRLPAVVFVALPVRKPVPRLPGVFPTMPTSVRTMPLCLCLCSHACSGAAFASYLLWGHPKLHGMPVVMAKESMFEVDAATLPEPMPMPCPSICLCTVPVSLFPSPKHKETNKNVQRSTKSNPEPSQMPLL